MGSSSGDVIDEKSEEEMVREQKAKKEAAEKIR